jgi:hypothetical protein
MFLSSLSPDVGPHELDFRFEVFPDGEGFLFAHHGAKLNELMEVCGLPNLGSHFYLVDMAHPFTLPDVIRDPSVLRGRYGVEPPTVYDRFLEFDSDTAARFFKNTEADDELDCMLIGTDDPLPSEQEAQRLLDALRNGPGDVRLTGLRCWIRTHDNHFLWLGTKGIGLLRTLIASTLIGFFRHVHPFPYTPVPESLIDLILANYRIAPLVCFPSALDDGPADVQVSNAGIQALVETAASSWIAYRLNPPEELVGRGLLITFEFRTKAWSFEEWS